MRAKAGGEKKQLQTLFMIALMYTGASWAVFPTQDTYRTQNHCLTALIIIGKQIKDR